MMNGIKKYFQTLPGEVEDASKEFLASFSF
jgi:hypothetical protein